MHIVHVYKDYPPVLGGIEQHIRLLAERQVRRGSRVTVLVTGRDRLRTTHGQDNGVAVIRAARLLTAASTPLSPALVLQRRALRPTVTHLHFPYPVGEVAHLLAGPGRPSVVTYHSDIVRQRWLGRLYRPLMWRVLRRADRVLATSDAYRRSSPVLRRLDARCQVLPLGIDLSRFAAADPSRAVATDGDWPRPRVLFVGRLRYYKGLHVLLDAMEQVPSAHLRVIGRGPQEAVWRARAGRLGCAPRITFLGDVDDDALAAHYAAADVVVLPSTARSEAFGLVQIEAMAAGTPVVSTELGTGTSEVNRDGETGAVVPPGDVEALATALRQLLADPRRLAALGDAARRHARERFDIDHMAGRLDAIYREVVEGRPPRAQA